MTNTKYALIAATIAILSLAVVPMQSAEATIFSDISDEINRAINNAKNAMIATVEASAQKVTNNVITDNKFLIDEQSEVFVAEIQTTRESVKKSIDDFGDKVNDLQKTQVETLADIQTEISGLRGEVQNLKENIGNLEANIAELKELLNNPGNSGSHPGKP